MPTDNHTVSISGKYHYQFEDDPEKHLLLFYADKMQFNIFNDTINDLTMNHLKPIDLTAFKEVQKQIELLKKTTFKRLHQYKEEKLKQNNNR